MFKLIYHSTNFSKSYNFPSTLPSKIPFTPYNTLLSFSKLPNSNFRNSWCATPKTTASKRVVGWG